MFNQCLDTYIMINYDNFQGNVTEIINITPDFESDHKFNFYPKLHRNEQNLPQQD